MTATTNEEVQNPVNAKFFSKGLLPHAMPESEVATTVMDAVKRARASLLLKYPFLGYLIVSTEYYFSDEIPTACATTIGGPKVYMNPDFMAGNSKLIPLKTLQERAFVIAHEIMHIYLEHVGRGRERNYHPGVWNIAADYAINWYLSEMGEYIKLPPNTLFDEQYAEMSADAIYHKLMEEGGGDPDEVMKMHGSTGELGENGQMPMDEVSSETVSDTQRRANRTKVQVSVTQGSKMDSSEKGMGRGAAGLLRAFTKLLEVQVPWQDTLRDFVVFSSKQRSTYNRISRRSQGRVVFPTMTGDFIRFAFGVDTSGSMGADDLNEAVTEIYGVLSAFDSWEFKLLSCDTSATDLGTYVSEEGDDFTTINLNMVGGGGTDMNAIVDYVNEMEDEVNVLVICTDGYIPAIENVQEVPVILLVTSAGAPEEQVREQNPDCIVIKMNRKDFR